VQTKLKTLLLARTEQNKTTQNAHKQTNVEKPSKYT